MRVRVIEGEKGFYGGQMYSEGQEFDIVERKHSKNRDDKGDPQVITKEQQFSKRWMERAEVQKTKKPASSNKD